MSESIFKISTDLARLVSQRADLIESLTIAPTVADQVSIGNAIAALEQQIRDDAKPTAVAKVDSFRGYYLHQKMLRDAAKQEKQRQSANEKSAQDVMDLMERISKTTLEELGKDRLEGKLGVIRLQTNGGVEPPPLISQPELVPDELAEWHGKLNNRMVAVIVANLREETAKHIISQFTRVPSPALIREALLQPCQDCEGSGKDYDTSECDEHTGSEEISCSACGGTGRNAVPGCSLQQRGSHIRVS